MATLRIGIGILFLLAAATVIASESAPGPLEPLAALAGHCWVAPMGEKLRDVQCYRWAYGRQFLVSEHMVQGTDPRYEGTTWYGWDGREQRIVFHYYTSVGAISRGHLQRDGESWDIIEEHVDDQGRIIQVRSRFRLVDDFHYEVQSQHDGGNGGGPPTEARYRRMDAASQAQPGIRVEIDGRHWTLAWNAQMDGRWQPLRLGAEGAVEGLPGNSADEWLWNTHGDRLLLLSRQVGTQQPPGWRAASLDDWRSDERQLLSDQLASDATYACRSRGCALVRRDEGRSRLWWVPADGSAAHWWDPGEGANSDPQWSPDEKQLLLRSDRGGSWELWLGDAEGNDARMLTDDPANDAIPAHHYGGEGPARFSPDGQQIVWTRCFPDRCFDIWIMNVDGSGARNLTADHAGSDAYPVFSPDGRWIAFSSERDGNIEIYLMRPDGSELQRITYRPDYDLAPLWVPMR